MMPKVALLPASCLALAAVVGVGCADGDAPRPNVLLISVDTLRADHLGCYGYPQATSPTIDALADRGVVFDRFVSTSSWTLPSHVSLLTGKYPASHGVQDDGVTLSPAVGTLAERLEEAGYHTLAVVSHVYVSSQFGLERGFARFDDSLIEGGSRNPVAGEVVERALRLFDDRAEEPFFAFLHFFDPHWDYQAPPPYRDRFTDPRYRGPIDGRYASMRDFLAPGTPMAEEDLRQLIGYYDGEIAYLDAQLERLFDELDRRGLLERTVVILTGDHGEEFKEHGMLGHGRTLFGEQLSVPLVIAGVDRWAGTDRRLDLTSLVDLAPTVLELAGVEAQIEFDGHSLLSPRFEERAVFAESIRFGSELRAAMWGPFKMIHRLEGDLRVFYDLAEDPGEQSPLRKDPTAGTLSASLEAFAARADRGWHLKLIAARQDRLEVRARVETPGRIVRPRRYFSARARGSRADFATFELVDEGVLVFDVDVVAHVGEVVFDTDPADAPVTLQIEVASADGPAGVYLGPGEPVAQGAPVTLQRADPRLTGSPPNYRSAPSGVYVRAVPDLSESAPPAELSDEALEQLRSLGYID